MAVANNVDNTVSVLLGNGDGTFQTAVNYAVAPNPVSLAAADFTGAGRLDLAVDGSSNVISVLEQTQAPSIISPSAATFTVGVNGSVTVAASGFPAPTFGESGALPNGVSLNPATGVLSGTPAAGTGGSYVISITASNAAGTSAAQSFTLTVNQEPVITSATAATFTTGAAGSFTVTATGFPAPAFSETGALPAGVSLNTTTGVMSGTPAAGTGGSYVISITASNAAGTSAAQSFTLTVNQEPVITSATAATFTTGAAGSFTVTATGFPAPAFSETGALPAGVSFNTTTGVLSGTLGASAGGSYPLTFTATNAAGTSAVQSFTLTVNQLPAVTSANKTTFTVGTSGTFTVTGTGFPAPTFSETGALPAGVSLNTTTGVMSGTPAAGTGGSYVISITASNAAGTSAAQSFTLTVDQAPVITSATAATFTAGTASSFTVTAAGFPAPTFTKTGTLPAGVTFVAGTGVLSGTPGAKAGGSYPLTFTATNAAGTSAAQSFTLTVNQLPAVTSANNTTFTVGTSGTFTVTGTGFPAPLTFAETGALPAGVSLNTTTGVMSGTPAAGTGGSYVISITASNAAGTSAAQSFTLTVDQAPVITSATAANSRQVRRVRLR